jgi:hypothetical protein
MSTHVLLRRCLESAGHAEVLARVIVIAKMLLEPMVVVAVEDFTTPKKISKIISAVLFFSGIAVVSSQMLIH